MCAGESLVVGNSRAQVALVFSEGYFAVHPLYNLIVLYLLLDVELGEFG